MKVSRILVVAAAALVLAAPAMAQEKDGFRVGLAGVLGTKLANVDLVYGSDNHCSVCHTGSAQHNPLGVDFGTKGAWQLEFGYRVGDDAFKFNYWYYKNDGSSSVASLPTHGSHFYRNNLTDEEADRIDANGTVKCHVTDFIWEHTFAKSAKARWAYQLGLRESMFKVDSSILDLNWDGTVYSQVGGTGDSYLYSETRQFGVLVGLATTYNFTPRLRLEAAVRAAYLQGKTDASMRQIWFDGSGTYYATDYFPVRDARGGFSHFEVDARLNYNIAGGFDAFAGYQQRVFNRAFGAESPASSSASGGFGVSDPAFRGWLLGVAYNF